MTEFETVFSSTRAALPDGVRPADIGVRTGRIAAVEARGSLNGAERLDFGDLALLPGLCDIHVHFNDPGRADWEGFPSGTAAAAAGGVTTIVDMPLNSTPVTVTADALAQKHRAAQGACRVDYGLWGGLVPGGADRIDELLDAGALGIKCFLCDSGLDEFPGIGREDLLRGARRLAHRGRVLLVHAEDPSELRPLPEPGVTAYPDYLQSRPPAAERTAIAHLVDTCAATGCRTHVVHLADAGSLETLADARGSGLPISVETCPHYLTLAAEDIEAGNTLAKCAPPIRERDNREGLWRGLETGVIDTIGSDHSPCPPAMRRTVDGDFFAAWGGIAGVQLALPLVWTEAGQRGHGLDAIVRWMAAAPAGLAGLGHLKGRIAPRRDADIVVFDPERELVVGEAGLLQRHPQTPYEGMRLRGTVVATFVRGHEVFADGAVRGDPIGRPLTIAPDTGEA